jgi:hypothetical protein
VKLALKSYVRPTDTGFMVFSIVGAWAATTVWVAFDAPRRVWSRPVAPDGIRVPRIRRSWTWALATLLAWPIAFPIYVYQRANAPLRPPS